MHKNSIEFPTVNRRRYLKALLAAGASGFLPNFGLAQPARRGSQALPARGEYLIRNAYVMTMDRTQGNAGDIAGGDVHIGRGEIVAVGKALSAPGATVIDGRKMIVMPGLIDTHWHMWNTLLRSFAGEKPGEGYFPTAANFGKVMTADDVYHGTRLATVEAVYSGVTTVHSFLHNLRSRQHAEADIRALRESGLRARWSYGWPQGLPDTEVCDLEGLRAMHKDWAAYSNDGLITMGFAWRGMFRDGRLPLEIVHKEFDTARSLGLPISTHVGSAELTAKGQIEAHAKENLLGKDVQIIHAVAASPAEIEMVAKSDTALSVSPGSELRIGYGLPKVSEFLAAGVRVGVSTDTTALTGDANMFGILKLLRDAENARAHDEFKMLPRRVLELGTIDGARSLGIDDRVGSLKPGKRADVIMISTEQPNMGVFTDPAHLVLEATQAANVDTVIVDGRILKLGGKLTGVAMEEVLAGAANAFEAVRKRANWR